MFCAAETWLLRSAIDEHNTDATLNDLREAVTTLEETERTARRVLGGDHPLAAAIEYDLQNARAALRARETPSSPSESV